VALLTSLGHFYDIQDYHTWRDADAGQDLENDEEISDSGQDLESDEEISDSEQSVSLEDAVKRHPELAVDALAPLIGLDEDTFNAFQLRAAKFKQQPNQQVSKRKATERQYSQKRRQLRTPPPRPEMVIPLHKLIESPKSVAFSSSHELDNAVILYGESSARGRAKRGRNDGSTTTEEIDLILVPSQQTPNACRTLLG
jgi:hypothetical protein